MAVLVAVVVVRLAIWAMRPFALVVAGLGGSGLGDSSGAWHVGGADAGAVALELVGVEVAGVVVPVDVSLGAIELREQAGASNAVGGAKAVGGAQTTVLASKAVVAGTATALHNWSMHALSELAVRMLHAISSSVGRSIRHLHAPDHEACVCPWSLHGTLGFRVGFGWFYVLTQRPRNKNRTKAAERSESNNTASPRSFHGLPGCERGGSARRRPGRRTCGLPTGYRAHGQQGQKNDYGGSHGCLLEQSNEGTMLANEECERQPARTSSEGRAC